MISSAWMTAVLVAVAVATMTSPRANRENASIRSLPFGSLSFEEAQSVGAVGTGCTWLSGPDRTRRLAMADDRAAVKLRGSVIRLTPAPGAPEVFPFTYHKWVGADMKVEVRDLGRVLGRGGEYVETVAWLDVTSNGRTVSWRGRLNCGS